MMELKKLLYKIPGVLEWRLRKNVQVAPWSFAVGDQHFEVLEDVAWLDKLHVDDRRGKLTGVDREGRYEASFAEMFVSKIDKATVMLDVGAAHGLYSVIAASRCLSQNIYCFEPDPASRWILQLNNEKYCGGHLRVDSRLVAEVTESDKTTIDDYCARHNIRPTLVKMDIEGAEYEVIHSLSTHLLERFRIIVVEFHELDRLIRSDCLRWMGAALRKLLRFHKVVHIHPNNCSTVVLLVTFNSLAASCRPPLRP